MEARDGSVRRSAGAAAAQAALGRGGAGADLAAVLASNPWWRRESILVACSGGLDSVVLLDLLWCDARARGERLRLGAACFDHGWRGAEGGRDAGLVQHLCAEREIPFFHGAMDAGLSGRRERRSPEAAARQARYAFLADVARREGLAAVATAHHARDQAETLLLRLARAAGVGSTALAGIRPTTRLSGVEVVRPLLRTDPEELLAYAEVRRLPFREDESNADPRFPRNRLRGAASRVRPDDAWHLAHVAWLEQRLVAAACGRLEDPLLVTAAAERPLPARRNGLAVPIGRLRALAPELRRELLRRFVRRVTGASALPARQLAQLESLLAAPEGGQLALHRARARVSCGWLLVEPAGAPALESKEPGWARTQVRGAPREAGMACGRSRTWTEELDPTAVRGRLVLRSWRPGDRLETEAGRKKLKALFREARIPVWDREAYPVLADERDVLWVAGLRRSARARPRPGAPVLRVAVLARTDPPGSAKLVIGEVGQGPSVGAPAENGQDPRLPPSTTGTRLG